MAPHTKAVATTDSTHVSIPFLACAVCRHALEANAEPQQPEDPAALKKIAADLYHELLAARAVISELTNNLPPPQKRIASTKLYEAGFMGASGGMTRAAERHKVLAAAEAAGLKRKTAISQVASAVPNTATLAARVRRITPVLTNRTQHNAVGATYSLANERGEKIALVSIAQQGLGSTRHAATRMALSGELTSALRAASRDYESSGAVSPETMNRMRQVLGEVDA